MRALQLLLAASLMVMAAPSASQETRVASKDHVPPSASIKGLDWLVGQWAGEGIQGAPAYENWLPPTGGTMVGTFVQATGSDPDDMAIMFTEHLYLMEHEGSLVLKLKHFNPDLTSWEERDEMLTFRLIEVEDCAIYFSALTLRCDEREDGKDGLLAAVRMKSDKPEPQELIFRFARMDSPKRKTARCLDAETSLATNECYAALLGQAEARMQQYLEAALGQLQEFDAQTFLVRSTQEGFMAYRGGECGGVHEQYDGESIRNTMFMDCAIRLTDERTHTIWRNWLTYMDSTPPVLPEPGPTS